MAWPGATCVVQVNVVEAPGASASLAARDGGTAVVGDRHAGERDVTVFLTVRLKVRVSPG